MTAPVKGQSGHVPGGARQTGDKPAAHRIAGHDDWDGRGRIHGSNRAWIGPGRDDDIDPEPDQVCGQGRQQSPRLEPVNRASVLQLWYGSRHGFYRNSVIICYVAARYAEVGSRRPNSWVPYGVRLIRVPATKRVELLRRCASVAAPSK
jgi:hypothetical protein